MTARNSNARNRLPRFKVELVYESRATMLLVLSMAITFAIFGAVGAWWRLEGLPLPVRLVATLGAALLAAVVTAILVGARMGDVPFPVVHRPRKDNARRDLW